MPSIERSSAVALFNELLRFRIETGLNPNSEYFLFADFIRYKSHLSKAQLFQDLLVLFLTEEKKGGFFVEFGATDGLGLSNSLLLEREYRWKGILAEPAKSWHSPLRANRKAIVDQRCVWSETGIEVLFSESEIGEFSSMDDFWSQEVNASARKRAASYVVPTVSLNDLLREHSAPDIIDYISIDTEGSERDILEAFDFSRYDVRIFTVEHNWVEPNREIIRELMMTHGYVRILESISRFDDWYVKSSFFERRMHRV